MPVLEIEINPRRGKISAILRPSKGKRENVSEMLQRVWWS